MNNQSITSSLCAAALLGLAAVSATGCASARGRLAARDFQHAVASAAEVLRPSSVIVRTKVREAKTDEAPSGFIRIGTDAGAPAEMMGIVVDGEGRILIPALIKPSETRLVVVVEGEEQEARFLVSDEAMGMTLMQASLPAGTRALPYSNPSDLSPGQWMVSLARGDDSTDFESRVIATLCTGTVYDRYRSFVMADVRSSSLLGAPVVDLDGVPVGIVGGNGVLSLSDLQGELVALLEEASGARSTDTADAEERERNEGKVRLGILTQPLNSNLAHTRGLPTRALLVTCVSSGSCAEAAGLKEGDIIVGLNDAPLRFRDSALQAWFGRAIRGREDAPFQLSLLRDGKPLHIEGRLRRIPEPEKMQAHDLGFTVATLEDVARVAQNIPAGIRGLLVTDVRKGGPASVAADDRGGFLRKGDLLLELDNHPVPTIADFRRELLRLQNQPEEYVQVKILRGRITMYAALNLRQNPALPATNGNP